MGGDTYQNEGSKVRERALGHVIDANESGAILDRIEGGPAIIRRREGVGWGAHHQR
jgi:hypothetical protein